jgi:hypothetical protein
VAVPALSGKGERLAVGTATDIKNPRIWRGEGILNILFVQASLPGPLRSSPSKSVNINGVSICCFIHKRSYPFRRSHIHEKATLQEYENDRDKKL